jgi:hypothetical protein
MSRKSTVLELEPLVCCLPGYENVTIEKNIVKRLTRKFYYKTGSELRLEAQQRIKLLNYNV